MCRKRSLIGRMITGLGLSAVLCFGSLGESLQGLKAYAAGEEYSEEAVAEAEDKEETVSSDEAVSADDAAEAAEEAVSENEAESGKEAVEPEEEGSGNDASEAGDGEPADEQDPVEEGENEGVLEEDEMDPNRKANELWITTIDDRMFYYDGSAYQPRPRIYYGDFLLHEGKDYSLGWAHNVKAYEMENKAYPGDDDFESAPRVIITMKGSYTGSTLAFFDIHPVSLTDGRTTISETTLLYTGKKQSYTPDIHFMGKPLKYKEDFDFGVLEGEELRKLTDEELTGRPGENVYTIVTIKGKGNFEGYQVAGFNIFDKDAVSASKLKISAIPTQPYTGAEVTSDTLKKKGNPYELSVSYGGTKLVKGVDYTISDPVNAIEPGKYCFVIRGMNSAGTNGLTIVGERTVGFTISASIKAAVVNGVEASYKAEPGALFVRPDETKVRLVLGGKELPVSAYSISYKNDTKAGTATMTFTGKNGYTGKIKKKYKINPTDINSLNFVMADGSYLKKGAKPDIRLFDGLYQLEAGKDYTVSCKNNKALSAGAGKKAVAVFKGKGFYSDKAERQFEVVRSGFTEAAGVTVTAADKVWSEKAGAYTTKIKVTDAEGSTLKAGVDYEKEIVYKDSHGNVLTKNDTVNPGDVITVEVTGKGNFSIDKITTTYRILEKGYDISKASASAKEQQYNGGYEPVTLPLDDEFFTVKLGGKKLYLVVDGHYASGAVTDPEVNGFEVLADSYKNNTKCGTASVTIRGVGIYGGTKTVKFAIKPAKIKGIDPVKFIPKPEKCIEVTDYGAIPDDGKDDTNAINAAISAAADDNVSEHTIYFPAGKYNVGASGNILLDKSGVKLVLDGEAELYVAAKAGEGGYNVILIRADNVSIRGGILAGERFRHSGGSIGQYGRGIAIDRGKNITIRDMIIKDNRGDGIYINDGGHGTVSNVTIKGCDIYDNARNNVCVIRGDYITIEKCHMYYEHDGNSPMACIDLEPDASGSVPENKKINHVVIRNCKLETYKHWSARQQASGEWAYFGVMIIYGFGTPVVRDVLIENCEIFGDLSRGSSSDVRTPGTTIHGQDIPGDT